MTLKFGIAFVSMWFLFLFFLPAFAGNCSVVFNEYTSLGCGEDPGAVFQYPCEQALQQCGDNLSLCAAEALAIESAQTNATYAGGVCNALVTICFLEANYQIQCGNDIYRVCSEYEGRCGGLLSNYTTFILERQKDAMIYYRDTVLSGNAIASNPEWVAGTPCDNPSDPVTTCNMDGFITSLNFETVGTDAKLQDVLYTAAQLPKLTTLTRPSDVGSLSGYFDAQYLACLTNLQDFTLNENKNLLTGSIPDVWSRIPLENLLFNTVSLQSTFPQTIQTDALDTVVLSFGPGVTGSVDYILQNSYSLLFLIAQGITGNLTSTVCTSAVCSITAPQIECDDVTSNCCGITCP